MSNERRRTKYDIYADITEIIARKGHKITIGPCCDVNREVQYTGELRLGERVSLAAQPKKVDKLLP